MNEELEKLKRALGGDEHEQRIALVVIFVIGTLNKFVELGILEPIDGNNPYELSESGQKIYEILGSDETFNPTMEEMDEAIEGLDIKIDSGAFFNLN